MKLLQHLSFMAGIVRYHISKKRVPLMAVLTVTKRCNLRCIYCFGAYPERKYKDFTSSEIITVIDDLASCGTRIVSISGGEPLIREDIGDIIARVKKRNILCLINTNGLLVEERIESLRQLDSLCIGFDGKEAENDLNRGKDSFGKIMGGIKAAKSLNIPLHTVCVITKNNINSIDYIVHLAREMGFTAEFNITCGLLSENDTAYTANIKGYKEAISKIIAYKRMNYPILFSSHSYEFVLNWLNKYSQRIFFDDVPEELSYVPCYSGKLECFIDADGFLYPCYQLIGRYPAENIKVVGFETAWNNLNKNIRCKTCCSVCSVEHNNIFHLNPGVIYNNVKNVLLHR